VVLICFDARLTVKQMWRIVDIDVGCERIACHFMAVT